MATRMIGDFDERDACLETEAISDEFVDLTPYVRS